MHRCLLLFVRLHLIAHELKTVIKILTKNWLWSSLLAREGSGTYNNTLTCFKSFNHFLITTKRNHVQRIGLV